MKRFLLISFILISHATFSQVAESCYRLYLTDKNNNAFIISQPEDFLSQKAIERRTKYGLDIKENDLPVSRPYLDSLKSLGVQIIHQSKWLNTVVVRSNNHELIDTITQLEFIKSKQKSYTNISLFENGISLKKNLLSELYNQSDYLDYGFATTQISMINGHSLHINGFKGKHITIGVIDAGFYNVDLLPAFDSLWANNQILGVKDFVDGDNQVFDASSHGMKVLSTMGGNIPGQLVGTAPNSSYWLFRTEDSSSESSIEEDYWVAAAEFADSVGCDIITSSLGYSQFDDPSSNYTYSDMDGNTTFITRAADIAASKGILVINSAGNLADDPWTYISAPADGDSVLTVGAVDAFATYAYFSGLGPTSDGRIKPNVAAMGYQTVVQGTNGDISFANGTSFSTPIIAGMAACLWQYYPELNNMEIIKKIEESGHQYSNPDYKLGYGIPDFGKAANLSSTNINTHIENATVRIYPNPFTKSIQIEVIQRSSENITVELFNITGRKIFQNDFSNIKSTMINIDNLNYLPSGIYFIKIIIGKQVIQKSISKI
ncbi:MAG: serine protease [Marinilabiliales bacterium]|nr:MAG: serine protease [Marinilabiliales bacterium]